MNKKILLAVSLLLNFTFGYAQCAYTGLTSPQVGSDYTFCIDNPNTITTAQVNAGQYVVVNVVKGFTYTFSVGEVFPGTENLTLFNAADNSNLGTAGYGTGATGASISSWTSTLSGKIKVLLSRASCINSSNQYSGTLTLTLNSVGNTQDSQTASGTDQWVGHVYNWSGSAPPGGTSPTTPTTTTSPFIDANYVGYYNIATETISENFGGDTKCFTVLVDGVNRTNIYTETFAVRYRMRSTKTGCYFLNVNGDDGVRVYVDNVLVFNQWKEQGNTSYCNNLIYLKGDSEIVLDYYENIGGNVVGFSLTPFDGSGNSIAGVATRNVCSGISPGVLDGSTFGNCTGGTNSIYQWQVSTDNVAFTDISGATSEDYTPPTQTATTTNIVIYYRRVLKPLVNNGGRCNFVSNFVTVTTSAGRPNAPGTITGLQKVCKTTSLTYSIAAVANAVSYTWATTATGWTITPAANGLSASIAFSAGATQGDLTVSASNGCGTSNSSSTLNIQVGDLPTSATISGNASVCVGAAPPVITITNPQNYEAKVIYTINGGSNNEVSIAANSSINYITAPTGTAGTFIYKLVSVKNGVGFDNCSTTLSDSVTVIVGKPITAGAITGTSTVCQGQSGVAYSVPVISNAVSYVWTYSGSGATISNGTTATPTITFADTATAGNLTVYGVNGCGNGVASANYAITVNLKPIANAGSALIPICQGGTTIQMGGFISGGATASLWTGGTGTWTNANNPSTAKYTAGADESGNVTLTLTASGGSCGTTTATKIIKINAVPVITVTKADESCSDKNDATINPIISGGLSNVRYIKVTQQINEFIQVAEIQAFEVFSGTNVALSSNGASAISSSNYLNNPTIYGPQKAIDGVLDTSNDFWHSREEISGENIKVDLGSGKNLKNIVIYNRDSNCCRDRGRDVLLELFDALDNLVYSKRIDLRGITGSLGFATINVINVSWADGATTLNRTGLDSGAYTFNYSDALGCSTSKVTTIAATSLTPVAPTVGTIEDIDCVNSTGSVTLTGLPAGNWTINPGNIFGTGVTKKVTGLTLIGNPYTFTVTNAAGCISPPSLPVVIKDESSTTWNGSAWSNDTPTSTKKIIFSGNYTFGANTPALDLVGCSCEVTTGTIIVPSGFTMTLTNELKVSGGSLTFEDKSSLVQTAAVATNNNTGPIIYKRTTPSLIETDYTYWSSPVAGQKLSISPEYDYGYMNSFDSNTNYWGPANLSTVMAFGVGYAIRGQRADNTAYTITSTFTGVPNNGTKTTPTGPTGNFVLLGNPYPSALKAEDFLDFNSNEIEGTIFFWTHKTAIQAASGIDPGKAGSGTFAYTSDDYAPYNSVGGVAVGIGQPSISVSLTPSGNIASGQAFFATSKGAGSVTFNNDMRVGGGASLNNNAQFFRTKSNAKTKSTIEKSRVWLDLSNSEGAFKQTLIGYVTNATNDYDDRYDGESFSANKYVDFYSVNNNRNFVIQGRALPFDKNDIVPLGYTSQLVGTFSIGINDADGLLKTQNIFLEDKLLNVIHDLKTASYSFTTQKGTFNDRFVLRYTDRTLGNTDFEQLDNLVLISKDKNELKIKSQTESIERITVFDLSGKKVFEKDKIGTNDFSSSRIPLLKQVGVVKVTLTNGNVITKKIAF
ncbi:T9SS sorting signal type C domain-containing protein [Flavobacterium sp. PL12]|uniref:T9SS sorting signal type C domain-containing protein n=1 Tax=Flavobacterium sp. PL12 TaxID=3071718 RepID=UPI00319E6F5B